MQLVINRFSGGCDSIEKEGGVSVEDVVSSELTKELLDEELSTPHEVIRNKRGNNTTTGFSSISISEITGKFIHDAISFNDYLLYLSIFSSFRPQFIFLHIH